MSKLEQAWNQAEACERHAQATKDTMLKAKFRKLRDTWIRVGSTVQFQEHVDNERQKERGQQSRKSSDRV